MSKVFAMVLTYNRKQLLRDCLASLRAQSRRCDRILVIDNASTDGTAEMLSSLGDDQVTAYCLPNNIGAAGGYNAGMRFAYELGADFIWAMDDDVIADPDALERLLSANEVLKARDLKAPFVISIARTVNGAIAETPEIDKRPNAGSYERWSELLEHKMVPVTRSTFLSILLPRSTLQQHGLPLASMFIWGEDSDYTFRITSKEPGWLVGDSRVVHIRALAGRLDIRTENNPDRIKYHFYHLRNDVYLKRRFDTPRAIARQIRKQIKLALQLCLRGDFSRAKIVLEGTLAGMRFNPVIEAADAPYDRTGIRVITS